jgi:hypothetical protein
MIYLEEWFMCTWEECLFHCGWIECSIGVCWVQLTYSIVLSCFPVNCWKWDKEVSNLYCWIFYSSLQLCQFLLHVFWGAVVRCIYGHVFISYWWIDPSSFWKSLFIFSNIFCFVLGIASPILFCLIFEKYIFLILLLSTYLCLVDSFYYTP